MFVATTTIFNIENQIGTFQNIVNFKKINNVQRINKFFEAVNGQLQSGGVFVGCAETYNLRKKRILKKFPPVFNTIYYSFDFLIRRVLPKLWLTKGIYFFLTRGNNRVLSKAETLGRLYSCGFVVIEESLINNLLFFAVRKIKDPVYDLSPTYGPFIKLRRVGKNGKMFNVYKLRTMHPYSEYIQKYVFDKYGSDSGDKANNDFRVTTLGRFFRKLWIDEFPMLINLLKGNIKLVGVRPLSEHKLSLYPKEVQDIRIKVKPGLLPPYYADLPENFQGLIESEMNYIKESKKSPIKTDLIYFFKIIYNIVIKKARSQ